MRLPASLKAEYAQLSADRSPYLERARKASQLTLPTLLPPAGRTGGGKLRYGYSNFGARCVNSLGAKLLLAVLPARQSFFRLAVDDALLSQMGGKELRAQVEAGLASMESTAQADIESTDTRPPVGEGIKHLIVAGNALLFNLPSGDVKVYPLDSYVCQRDGDGNVLSIIAEDHVSPETLPDVLRGPVKAKMLERIGERGSKEKTVCVFTGVFHNGNHYVVWQEVEGLEVPGSRGTYTLDACPWMPLRWLPVAGESYGRGMVEDYMGYFTALEALTASLVKGAAVAAKLVYLRKPNGKTKANDLKKAETGDVIDGDPEDVHALQSEKAYDFRTVREMIGDLKEELSYAFAMNQAVQRNAERVTAEEIRYMAQDLDTLLGGIYSSLSHGFQLPFLRVRLQRLQKAGKLPALPKKSVRPVIVTGLDALGRGAELDNLRGFVKDVVDLGGPEALRTELNFGDLMTRLATSRGIKSEGLVKTAEQKAQAQQQDQLQQLVAQLGPNAINQIGQLAKQRVANEGTQQ